VMIIGKQDLMIIVDQGYSIWTTNETVFALSGMSGYGLLQWQQPDSQTRHVYGMKTHGDWFVLLISKHPIDITNASYLKTSGNATESDILCCSV